MIGGTLAAPRGTVQSGAPVTRNGIPPWTPAWYQYCSNKYKSFNPQTGLYLGYDGKYHYCR
ncbi:BA14K family protein [Amorphus sp. 3PC139-8]